MTPGRSQKEDIMQAIKTKYLSPTNSRAARLVVTCPQLRRVYEWDCELDAEENHVAAAKKLLTELHWTEEDGYPPIASAYFSDVTCFHVFLNAKELMAAYAKSQAAKMVKGLHWVKIRNHENYTETNWLCPSDARAILANPLLKD